MRMRQMLRNRYTAVVAGGVLAASCYSSSAEMPHYAGVRSIETEQGTFQWPLAVDPIGWGANVSQNGPLSSVRDVADRLKSLVPTGILGSPEEAAVTGPLADNTLVTQAATQVQTEGIPNCPDVGSDYRVSFKGESKDPTATICLDGKTLKMQQIEGVATVVMEMAVHPGYMGQPWATLKDSMEQYTPEQCDAVTNPLQQYGQSLLQATGLLPAGQSATLEVVVGHNTRSVCDTWIPPAPPSNMTPQ